MFSRSLTPAAAVFLAISGLLACDQDYAASNAGRETFMGAVQAVPPSSAPPPAPPPPAPPPIPPSTLNMPTPSAAPSGSASAAPSGSAMAAPAPSGAASGKPGAPAAPPRGH